MRPNIFILQRLLRTQQLKKIQRAGELLLEARRSDLLLQTTDNALDPILVKLAEIIGIETAES